MCETPWRDEGRHKDKARDIHSHQCRSADAESALLFISYWCFGIGEPAGWSGLFWSLFEHSLSRDEELTKIAQIIPHNAI